MVKKEWCIPPEQNAAFVCQMEEVLSIYTQPYGAERPVVCLDESSKQLIGEVGHPIPIEPGQPERFDSEYSRKGVANLFIAFEPLLGQRLLEITEQRTRVDFAHFVKKLVDEHYPTAKTIVFVMDNLNTHDKRLTCSLGHRFWPSTLL